MCTRVFRNHVAVVLYVVFKLMGSLLCFTLLIVKYLVIYGVVNHHLDPRSFIQERRYVDFVSIKRQIIACMEDLEQMPDTSFERDVVCEEEEAFCLSLENITALNVLLSQVHAHMLSLLRFIQTTRCIYFFCFISHNGRLPHPFPAPPYRYV